MKVLFFTRYPIEGASSRYRVHQYVDDLKAMGVECDVYSFMNSDFYKLSYTNGNTPKKIVFTIASTVKRIAQLLRYKKYDIVYMQREFLPFLPPFVEFLLCKSSAITVFDYDDALFIHKPSKHSMLATLLRRSDKTVSIFGLVDCVIAGNDYLRDVASEHCSESYTLNVAEDTERFKRAAALDPFDGITIGWLGSKSTENYLELIRQPLERLSREHSHVRLKIIGGGEFESDVIRVEHCAWELATEAGHVKSFDIGIMPLPIEKWSKGKSGGKARTYMAAGLPAVCTSIGYNIELIQQWQTGVLVEDFEDWYRALSLLIQSKSKRKEIGFAAQQYVEEQFSVLGQAEKLKLILEKLADKRNELSSQ